MFVILILTFGEAFAGVIISPAEGSPAPRASVINIVNEAQDGDVLSDRVQCRVKTLQNLHWTKDRWEGGASAKWDQRKLIVRDFAFKWTLHRQLTVIPIDDNMAVDDPTWGVANIDDVELARKSPGFGVGFLDVNIEVSNAQPRPMSGVILVGSNFELPLHERVLLVHDAALPFRNTQRPPTNYNEQEVENGLPHVAAWPGPSPDYGPCILAWVILAFFALAQADRDRPDSRAWVGDIWVLVALGGWFPLMVIYTVGTYLLEAGLV